MKLGMAGLLWVALGFGVFYSVLELRYEFWGEATTGKVVSAKIETRRSGGRYRRNKKYLVLKYVFTDETGMAQSGTDSIRAGSSSTRQVGQIVDIQFLKGSPQTSRLKSSFGRLAYLLLLGAGVSLAGYYWNRRQLAV